MIDRRSLYYRPTFLSPAVGKSGNVPCISSARLPAHLPVSGARELSFHSFFYVIKINTNLLSIPFVGTSFLARSYSVAAPTIWNSLSLQLSKCVPALTPSTATSRPTISSRPSDPLRLFSCTSDSASASHHCVR